MDLHVKGKNLAVTDALFEHAEKKLAKFARVMPAWENAPDVEVELSVERNPSIDRNQVCELTVRTKGPVLRVREADRDMYTAIDHAAQKLERQARKYRDRRTKGRHARPEPLPADEMPIPAGAIASPAAEPEDVVDEPLRVVRTKRFDMAPMGVDEAADHIDLVDHDFYVFRNADDGDAVTVIYRRRDGDLGLIAPA